MDTITLTVDIDHTAENLQNNVTKNNKSHDYVVSVQKNTVLYYTKINKNKTYKERVNNSIIPDIVLPEDYE